MKTNITIPSDFYEKLYDEIMNFGFVPESEDDCHCDMDIEIGEFGVSLCATFDIDCVDVSFDHAFGTEHACLLEAEHLSRIGNVEVWHYDESNNGVDVTEQFDEQIFWAQAK